MRAVIQRVSEASVEIEGNQPRSVGRGLLILLGIARNDSREDVMWMVKKISGMRIFTDTEGRMNLSLSQIGGDAMVVSQFTLLADTKKGNRPSFDPAAPPEIALPLYESFVEKLGLALERKVFTGVFGASMRVSLVNDGPVTIILDSRLRRGAGEVPER
ncbi:MAG: D-aminoacyl-tRNA deacylase [Spirochaetaceae bacterium]|nr:D-aminoacyl-tRNA deacylase [Spirochaetaceae bacterium]MDT8298669.1 D-aminoacyl-tRNA deacylase [Spirochaetaceae bacterium]